MSHSNNGSAVALSGIFRFTPLALRNQPAILVPFLIFAVIELCFLTALYFFPRQPFVTVFGPPVRVFFGERFLHYPDNFLLLPQLAAFSRTLLYVVAGSLLEGVAVALVKQAYTGESPRGSAFLFAARRYGALASVSFLVSLAFLAAVRLQAAFLSLSLFLFILNVATGVLIQAFFIYAVPVIVIEGRGTVPAMFRSFRLFCKKPLETLLLVTAPVLAYVPIMIFQYKTPFFVSANPESVFLIAAAGTVVNAMVVDMLVYISATFMYLRITRHEEE